MPEDTQRHVIQRVASALRNSGRFLFTAPAGVYPPWKNSLTNRRSVSLGKSAYVDILNDAGLTLAGEFTDEGDNDYFDAVRTA